MIGDDRLIAALRAEIDDLRLSVIQAHADTDEMGRRFGYWRQLAYEHDQQIQAMRAEIADLRLSVIAFGAPAMVQWARDMGLPPGHLFAEHYDILERAGARMDEFTRGETK